MISNMLRAVSSIYIESQALAIARRDVFKLFRTAGYAGISTNQTVLTDVRPQTKTPSSVDSCAHSAPPPPPPPPPPPRRGWVAAAAFALTASVGGVYFIRKLNTSEERPLLTEGIYIYTCNIQLVKSCFILFKK
ncbi:PREDICTED: uncharacterized protein LOC106107727 [Papilio polytes]|uniref:uncharacterized protein LOC106107727 n=1 Tax=Papilio polytes TaxID=76194 RepID=UPI000676528B|nr:PREDICTED: uncharacterized protein LOC106107727 [Papilio polytes]